MEGLGYKYYGATYDEVLVDEDYADEEPVIAIMPRECTPNITNPEILIGDTGGGGGGTGTVPVYEVKLGLFRCASRFGTSFLYGDFLFYVMRGEGSWDPINTVVSGSWPTQIRFWYERKYAQAAVKDWTIYMNAGWKPINIPWDTDWQPEKSHQSVAVYLWEQVTTQDLQQRWVGNIRIGPLSKQQPKGNLQG